MERLNHTIRFFLIMFVSVISFTLQAYDNYYAYYNVISRESNDYVGYYSVGMNQTKNENIQELYSEMQFSYPTSFFGKAIYRYADKVIYDNNGIVEFIIHIQDKNDYTITGVRTNANKSLFLQKFDTKTNAFIDKKIIKTEDFDYTIFALRFPMDCDNTKKTYTAEARILDITNWSIGDIKSQFVNHAERPQYTTHFTWSNKNNACLYVNLIGKSGEPVESWVSPKGYLIYEKGADYIMTLDESKSKLPETIEVNK